MAATNYTVFRPKHVDAIQFGDTKWTSANFLSTTVSLASSFSVNNGTVLWDAVGSRDANTPVKSEAWAKDIAFSGNERSVSEENLLGSDSDGAQNQETAVDPNSLQEVSMTLVYRNNSPLAIFNDTTECCYMSIDNEESATSGVLTVAMNDISMLQVGALTMNADGMMEQTVKFSHKGGTTGSSVSVVQAAPSQSWHKIKGGDYAEEIRIA